MNLLEETLEVLQENKKSSTDVDYVNFIVSNRRFYSKDGEIEGCYDWEWFLSYSKDYIDYDSGYGEAKVGDIEIVLKDGSWLERWEYDGSEGWEFKKTPERYIKEKHER